MNGGDASFLSQSECRGAPAGPRPPPLDDVPLDDTRRSYRHGGEQGPQSPFRSRQHSPPLPASRAHKRRPLGLMAVPVRIAPRNALLRLFLCAAFPQPRRGQHALHPESGRLFARGPGDEHARLPTPFAGREGAGAGKKNGRPLLAQRPPGSGNRHGSCLQTAVATIAQSLGSRVGILMPGEADGLLDVAARSDSADFALDKRKKPLPDGFSKRDGKRAKARGA